MATLDLFQFRIASKCLVKALGEFREGDNNNDIQEPLGWECRENEHGFALVHPSFLRPSQLQPEQQAGRKNEACREDEDNVNEEEDDYVDESVLIEDASIAANTVLPVQNSKLLTWNLSLVYSETYQVPVLYFHVQNNGGTLQSRTRVLAELEGLSRRHDDDNQQHTTIGMTEEQTWDFVSFDEHPVDRIPSLFLHPCHTRDRLALLRMGTTSASQSPEGIAPSEQLWQCLSLLLPAVGWPLSARTFAHIQSLLRKIEQEQTSL